MSARGYTPDRKSLVQFDRRFFSGKEHFTYIGSDSLGGKANGLAHIKGVLETELGDKFASDITVEIPTLTVIATDHFDQFMKQNRLLDTVAAETRDDLLAHAFQKADLPVQLVGDLRALAEQVHRPLAVRSSSMLEDAMFEPFGGIYGTKMIPNNQPDADTRFRRLSEAVKLVYASTYFADAREYRAATKHTDKDEKMAVIIQEVMGSRFDSRFYPNISGVARSYNFYPSGHAAPEDGVVDLAIGLGKTIVDDSVAWSYSPAYPNADPPYNSIGDLLKQTQTRFWAINMGKPPPYNPISETEHMNRCDLADAEYDGSIMHVASTYVPANDRIVMGTGSDGPRIINFAPILRGDALPLNDLLKDLLAACEAGLGSKVEIEFAVTLAGRAVKPARFGFLQVRPMVVSGEQVDLDHSELCGPDVLVASDSVMGNGTLDTIRDVVFVKPDRFDTKYTASIADQLGRINAGLVEARRPYLLIGFGRWGTSDPQGGIPVRFGQVSGAKAIVEATLPDLDYSLSQGSHFFHNLTSFRIYYFSIRHSGEYAVNWDVLRSATLIGETEYLSHVEFASPLRIKVDGKKGWGVITHERSQK
jgi:hypothetical protein